MNLGFVVSGDMSSASLKALLMNRLGSVQANLREVLVDAFPDVSAELYQNETAQARQLAMLAALMALACIVASSAYFTSYLMIGGRRWRCTLPPARPRACCCDNGCCRFR